MKNEIDFKTHKVQAFNNVNTVTNSEKGVIIKFLYDPIFVSVIFLSGYS